MSQSRLIHPRVNLGCAESPRACEAEPSDALRDQTDPLAPPADLLEPPGRCSGCWPHDGEVDGCAVEESGCGRTLMMMLLLRPPAARFSYGVIKNRRH
jgi:hypothetical protein